MTRVFTAEEMKQAAAHAPETWSITGLPLSFAPMLRQAARQARVIERVRADAAQLCRYVEYHAGIHDDDCPQDDTCDCSWKLVNDAVNRLCHMTDERLDRLMVEETR